MGTSKYDKFKALDPFFNIVNIVMKGLDGLVDGDHFWDAVADEAERTLCTVETPQPLARRRQREAERL